MPARVLSASRAGAGSAVATAAPGGTRQLVGVGTVAEPVTLVSLTAALRATSQGTSALAERDNVFARLSATSQGRASLAVLFPPVPANLLSPSRPGVRATTLVAVPPALSLPGHGHGHRPLVGIGAYPIVGTGVAAVTSLPPNVATLRAALQATSRAAGSLGGVRVSLTGQITASSRGGARFPSTVSLAGRITAQSTGRVLYAPPPNVVLTSWLRAASSGGMQATVATVRTQQDAVTVISG